MRSFTHFCGIEERLQTWVRSAELRSGQLVERFERCGDVTVTGVASTVDDQEFHGFFWKEGLMMTDIGTIKDDVCSIPHFMNSRGQVVGTSGCTEEGLEVHGFCVAVRRFHH